MDKPETVLDLLQSGAAGAPALGGDQRDNLTYAGLRALCSKTAASLATHGIGRGGRVAIVLPNGPEMAAAFIAIAGCATTAPLNPATGPRSSVSISAICARTP